MEAVSEPRELTDEELNRYSRNIVIPSIGLEGQKRLLSAKVLVVGAGGLGSPVLLYLAAAGVGTIGIMDPDVVDWSNLQRQVVHGETTLGKPKVESAREALSRLNSGVSVIRYPERLTEGRADEVIPSYDVVVDATDNFESRYLLNEACIRAGKPLVHGSVMRFEGQASVFWPPRGPCYRCLFPAAPKPGLLPSPAEAGVLGATPGVIGCIEAVETIKLLLGVGRPLVGRLLLFDGLSMEFSEVSVSRNESCPSCGKSV